MDAMEDRLSRLESRLRKWRLLSSTLLVGLLVLSLTGQVRLENKTIEAERVVFRDGAGRVRMELRSAPAEGKAAAWFGLMFYDDDGAEAGRVRMGGNTPMIQLKGSSKDAQAVTEATIQEGTFSEDVKASMRALASAASDEIAVVEPAKLVSLNGERNGTVIGGGLVYVYGGGITVKDDPKEKASAVLGRIQLVDPKTGASNQYPAATLTILDRDGKVRRQMP